MSTSGHTVTTVAAVQAGYVLLNGEARPDKAGSPVRVCFAIAAASSVNAVRSSSHRVWP